MNKEYLYSILLTPFLLGNSAPVGAIIPLLIGAVFGLAVIIGIVYGLVKWLT